jgi:hypothetical protein
MKWIPFTFHPCKENRLEPRELGFENKKPKIFPGFQAFWFMANDRGFNLLKKMTTVRISRSVVNTLKMVGARGFEPPTSW